MNVLLNPDLLKRLRPIYGRAVEGLWVEYQTADVTTRNEIEGMLNLLAYRALGIGLGDERILLEPPRPEVIGEGEYTIGTVIYPGLPAYPFRIRRKELLRHLFVLGPSGTGKSTLLLGILEQLLKDTTPFTVFDFKRNYRTLLRAEKGTEIVVLTVGRRTAPLRINALLPPTHIEFNEWAEALADICSTAYLLMQGARNVLKEALIGAYRKSGRLATIRDAYTLLDAELKGSRAGSRRYGWLESATRTLQELSHGGFGHALNTKQGNEWEQLLCKPLVFELEGLGDDQKRFFCLLVLQTVLLIRKHSQAPREQLQHVLVFDESHNVFPKDPHGELSVPSRLAREVREYGEAIIAATQQTDVADSLIANSGFKIILRCDFPRDVEFASKLLHVDAKWLPKLPLGFGIARLPLRHYTPFLFHFSEKPLKNQPVTDEEVQRRWEKSDLNTTRGVEEEPEGPPVSVTEKEHQLLVDILEHPITSITGRYARLGWNSYTGNAVKDKLLVKRLAFFDAVSTPNAQIKILSLTTDGVAYLKSTGIAQSRFRSGGAVHEYWRHTLKTMLVERCYTVGEEHDLGNGQTTDLLATKAEQRIFIEIETGKSEILSNIEKCRNLKGRVWFFFVNAALRDKYAPTVQHSKNILCLVPADLRRCDELLRSEGQDS